MTDQVTKGPKSSMERNVGLTAAVVNREMFREYRSSNVRHTGLLAGQCVALSQSQFVLFLFS